jgi:hypothetical protein
MGELPAHLAYLLMLWGVVTAMLVILVIYRGTLSTKEDDQLFLSKEEENMMGSEQKVLINKITKLSKPIVALTVLSGALLVITAGIWLWTGLMSV